MTRSITPSNKSVEDQVLREAVNDLLNGSNRAMRGDDLIASNIFEYDPAGRLRIGKTVQNMQAEINGTKVVINGITTGLQEIKSTFEMTNQGLLAQTRQISELATHVEILRKRGDQIESRITADSTANRELLSRVTANDRMIEVLARDQVQLSASLAMGEGSLSFMGNEVIANAEATQILETRVVATEDSITAMAQQITDLKASVNVLPRVFLQSNMPTSSQGPFIVGDMWLKSDDGNKVYVWDGTVWSESVDLQGATVYAQTTAPTGAGLRVGDIWFDLSNNNRMYRWNGTQWVDVTNPVIDATAAATAQLRADVTLIQGQVTANAQQITNLNTQIAGKADQSALNTLSARVTSAEGLITSQGNAITTLQGQIATKADASAVTALTTRMTAAEGLITSQGNAVTSLQNSVQQIGGDNQLGNSSFEDGTSPGSVPGWSNNSGGLGTGVTRRLFAASSLPNSTRAWRWELDNVPTTGYLETYSNMAVKTSKVTPGERVTLSAYVRGTAGARWYLQIAWRDAAGANISYTGVTGTQTLADENWTRKIFTTVNAAPANAVAAVAYLRIYGLNITGQWVEWDNVQLQTGVLATGYTPSAEEMATALGAQAAATTALTTRVTAAEGTISSLSSQVTDLSASLGAAGAQGSNMVIDGGFELTPPNGWTGITSGGRFTAPVEGRNGGKCLKVASGAGSSNTQSNNNAPMPVQPGRTYRISAWYKTDAAYNGSAANGKLRVADQGGGLIGGLTMSFVTNKPDWTLLEQTYTVPAGSTTGLRLSVTVDHTAGTLWVDDVVVEDITDSYANAAATQALTVRVTAAEGLITSQGTAITSLQSSITDIGGDNLLPNSSYEESTNATTAPTMWVVDQSGGLATQVSYVTSPLSGGGRAVRIDATTTANNQTIGLALSNTFADKVKVRAGVDYILTSYIRGTAGSSVQMFLQYVNSNNTVLETKTLPVVPTTGEWQRLQLTAKSTNTAVVAARVFVGRLIVPTPQAAFIELDNCMLQEGLVATKWIPSITGATQVTNANAAALTALTTRVTAAEGTITSQSTSITNLQTSLTTTSTDLTNLIANGNNVVFDGGFEGRNVGQGVGVGFVTNEAARSGTKSLKITATGAIRDVVVGTIRNVGDQRVWYCECWVRNSPAGGVTTGNIQLAANAYNSSGAIISYPQFKALAAASVTDTWQKLSGYVTAPAGTYTLGIRLSIRENVPSGAVLWDDVFAVDVTDAYNAKAVADATATALSTLDTKVTSIDGRVSAQATSITSLTASIDTTNGNVTNAQNSANAAQQAAQAAADAAAVKGKVLYQSATPAVADRLSQNLWIDTTGNANTPKRWNGTAWVAVTDKVATDAVAAAATAKAAADAAQLTANNTASVVVTMGATVSSIGRGGNLIANSSFPQWKRNSWGWYSNPHGFSELGNPTGGQDTAWMPTGVYGLGAVKGGSMTPSQDCYFGTEYFIGIEDTKTYCVSAYVSNHRCAMAIYAEWYNSSGTMLGQTVSPYNSAAIGQPVTLKNLIRLFAIGKPPAGATSARVIFRVIGVNDSNPYFWVFRPMFSEVAADATAPPPWMASGNEASAFWAVNVEANGVIAGLQLGTSGGTSNFKVRADVFEVTNSAGGQRTEYSNNNWRVYDNNGVLRVQLGVW